MKRVLILTYYWPPSGGPGVQRWLKFVKYLPHFGYEPIVLTVDPQKATYPVLDKSLLIEIPENLRIYHTSTREPYGLYKKLFRKKQVPYSGFANETGNGPINAVSRFIRGNLFVPDARIGWNRYAISRAIELIEKCQIETFITTSPPHSTQLAGVEIKNIFPQIRWIADLRDPWTDIYYYDKMLHLPWVKKKDLRYEKKVLEKADVIITVSDFLQNLFTEKFNDVAAKDKIKVITNGFDPDDFKDIKSVRNTDSFTVTYVGTIAHNYNLNGFIKAMEYVKTEVGEKLHIQFTGSISPKWKKVLKANLKQHIDFHKHVEHSEAIRQMKASDMLLLVVPEIINNEGIITGKVFEYLASERPILGIGPVNGDASGILEKTGSGKMFSYEDHENISKFVLQFALKEKEWFPDHDQIQKFSRKRITENLVKLIEKGNT